MFKQNCITSRLNSPQRPTPAASLSDWVPRRSCCQPWHCSWPERCLGGRKVKKTRSAVKAWKLAGMIVNSSYYHLCDCPKHSIAVITGISGQATRAFRLVLIQVTSSYAPKKQQIGRFLNCSNQSSCPSPIVILFLICREIKILTFWKIQKINFCQSRFDTTHRVNSVVACPCPLSPVECVKVEEGYWLAVTVLRWARSPFEEETEWSLSLWLQLAWKKKKDVGEFNLEIKHASARFMEI